MVERQIGHRKSCLVLSAHFPVVKGDVPVLLLNQPIIRSSPCGCRLASSSVCRNRRSAPASFVHRCTSPLRSFSFLCSWRCPSLLPARICTAPCSACFDALISLLRTLCLSFHVLHEITLSALRNSANTNELQLEQPRLSRAPFVHLKSPLR